ncbi:hypothetical protein [Chlorobium limicola]
MKKNRHILKTDWNKGTMLTSYWKFSFLVLIAGSLLPIRAGGTVMLIIDPLIHIALYTMLSFVPMVLLENRKAAFLVSTAMMPLGYLLETLHVMTSGSSFNALNALFNNIGVLVGIAGGIIVRLLHHYREQHAGEEHTARQNETP